MPDNFVPTAELAIDLLISMMSNPKVNPHDKNLPDIAINHAKKLIEELEQHSSSVKH